MNFGVKKYLTLSEKLQVILLHKVLLRINHQLCGKAWLSKNPNHPFLSDACFITHQPFSQDF